MEQDVDFDASFLHWIYSDLCECMLLFNECFEDFPHHLSKKAKERELKSRIKTIQSIICRIYDRCVRDIDDLSDLTEQQYLVLEIFSFFCDTIDKRKVPFPCLPSLDLLLDNPMIDLTEWNNAGELEGTGLLPVKYRR